MPSLEGVVSCSGRLNPRNNEATLTLTDHAQGTSLTWVFRPGVRSRDRWQKLGISPVVWQFAPPKNLPFLRYGDAPCRATSLLIAVARDVVIRKPAGSSRFSLFQVKQPELGVPAMSNPGAAVTRLANPWAWVDLNPQVHVIRVQNTSLMPSFDRPDSLANAMGSPYVLESLATEAKPLKEEDLDSSGNVSDESLSQLGLKRYGGSVPGLLVLPRYDGVSIRSLLRDFTISISVRDPCKPAGFAHAEAQSGSLTVVWVHANDNVRVSIDASEGVAARKRIWVFVRRTNLPYVPQQGEAIDRTRKFERVEIEESIVPGEVRFVFELLISFVPVVGTVYDLAQLAYMISTGKSFWGERVSAFDMVLGGSLCALSVAVPGIRALKSRARSKALVRILEGIDDVADLAPTGTRPTPVIEALQKLPSAEQGRLVTRIEKAIAADGPAALKAVEEAVTQALRSLDEPTRQALVDGLVKELFTDDLKSFRNVMLRVSYDFYTVSRKGKLSPLEWLLKTEAQWIDPYMKQLLEGHLPHGTSWQNAIKESFGLTGQRVRALDKAMLDQYDTIIAMGRDEYSALQSAVRKVPGLGQYFELDHILEQRFVRNFTEWTDALAEDASFMAILVPKNSTVAAEIVRIDPGSRLITYVHQAKTDLLRQLVPHGAEHLFSDQHIADATLYALKALGADSILPVKALETDFAILTLARKGSFDEMHALATEKGLLEAAEEMGMPKIRPWSEVDDKLVSESAGFPRVERVGGVWQLAGTAQAKAPR